MEGFMIPMIAVRHGIWWWMHPIVQGHHEDCTDDDCPGSAHLGAPIARGLTRKSATRNALEGLAKAMKNQADRAASEALGG